MNKDVEIRTIAEGGEGIVVPHRQRPIAESDGAHHASRRTLTYAIGNALE